jgi:outer membrane receptor protein involved in Fe transport
VPLRSRLPCSVVISDRHPVESVFMISRNYLPTSPATDTPLPFSHDRLVAPLSRIGAAVLALGISSPSLADREVELSDMVVTATKTQASIREVSAAVTVVTRDQIEKSTATTVDQLVQGIPGVYAARMEQSSPNRIAQVYSRGLPGNGRTLVLTDGIPMNVGYDGQVDWSQLTTLDVERIEVVRGAGSALYGNSAMGGVINIISRVPQPGVEKRIDVDYGSLDTKRLGASFSSRQEDMGVILAANRLTSDGYNMWRPDTTVPVSARAKTGTEKTNVSAKVLKEIDSSNLLDFNFSYLRDIATGLYTIPEYNAQDRQQYLASSRYRHFGESSETTALFYVRRGLQDADSGNAASTAISYRGVFKDTTTGLNLQSTHTISPEQTLTVGGEYVDTDVSLVNSYPAEPTRQQITKGKVNRTAAFVQDELKLGAARLNLAGRYDVWTTSGSMSDKVGGASGQGVFDERSVTAFTPKAGLSYPINQDIVVRGTIGKAFNTPDVSQLYGNSQRNAVNSEGNSSLVPETALTKDVGLDYYFGKLGYFKATLYDTDAKNFIYSVTTTGQNTKKQNIDKVHAQGLELEGLLRPVDRLSLKAGYTYNRSIVTASTLSPTLVNKRLINVPAHQGNLRADVSLPAGFEMFGVYNYVGYRFGTDSNSSGYKPYATYDFGVTKAIDKDVSLRLNVVNATNKKYEAIGYVAPGMTVTAGLTAKF